MGYMSRMPRFPAMVFLLVGALSSAALPALAAGPKGSESPADVLFQKAVKDMQAGRYDAACEALKASLKLEEKAGTMYALGDCEATRGHSEDALAVFSQYLRVVDAMKSPDREKHDERANVAREQVKRIQGELLFAKAKAARDAGRLDEACAALSQSYKVDARPGTLYSLADCEDSRGRIATAQRHYQAYLGAVSAMTSPTKEKHAERAGLAEARLSALEPDIPTVKLFWRGKTPDGLRVHFGGSVDEALSLDVRIAVDPGVVALVVESKGKAPLERTFTIQKGERKALELSVPTSVLRNEEAAEPIADAPPINREPSKGMSPMRLGGYVGIGVGGAALVLGGVFGGLAMKQKDRLQDLPCTDAGCPANRKEEVDRFRLFGNTSTAMFAVGTALAGAGVTLLLLSPKAEKKDRGTAFRVHSAVLPGTGYLSVEGSF